jgi:endoglucanase
MIHPTLKKTLCHALSPRPIVLGLLLSLAGLHLNGQKPPFKTLQGQIVDAKGEVFIMRGVNWWGANGSQYPYGQGHKGIDTHAMPFGLHVQHLDSICLAIKNAGFNTVRLPFSNQMLHDTQKAKPNWVGPNSGLLGLTPLQVLDSVVEALTEQGLFVLLNNHSTTTHWCCNYDYNGLWYGNNKFWPQTTRDWIRDWQMLALRFHDNPMVIGADLRNEVRPLRRRIIPLPKNPTWGGGGKRDWHKAATEAGNAIHQVNSELLIVVEGINAQAKWLTHLKFPHLKPVRKRPILLEHPQKVVYEVHNYGFSWSKANLARPKRQVRYGQMDTEDRLKQYEDLWGFVTQDDFEYQAPVVVGEFGCSSEGVESQPWLKDLTSYIGKKGLGFCWWTLEEDLESKGSYGIMNGQMNKTDVQLDWRWDLLGPLMMESNQEK